MKMKHEKQCCFFANSFYQFNIKFKKQYNVVKSHFIINLIFSRIPDKLIIKTTYKKTANTE